MSYPTLTAQNHRVFACYPAAVVIFIINPQEEILLLESPKRHRWEVISGAMEADETVLAGALREVREEVGPHIQIRPLGALHSATFAYDENVPMMLGLSYVMAYEGGEIIPGDDIAGAPYRWATPAQMRDLPLTPPAHQPWLAERAVELYRLYTRQNIALGHEVGVVE